MSVQHIDSKQAEQMRQNGSAVFIDVRSVGEALELEIPGSQYIPFDLVSPERMRRVGMEEGKTPVLVCRSGSRAEQAAKSVQAAFPDVVVLKGGIVQWKADGMPLNEGRKAVPLERQVLVAAGSMMLLTVLLGLAISPWFFALTLLMCGGMIFAGVTGACGMARILIMLPWNKKPLCGGKCTAPKRA